MNSSISIIIPTHNRAHLIAETLESILAQTYKNWECIIVDDGSTDNTVEILSQYIQRDSRFRYYPRPMTHKKGPNSCRNYGFEQSKGDYVKWFDSDDWMFPDLLEKQLSLMNDAEVGICEILKYDFEKGMVLGSNKIQSSKLIEDYFVGKIAFYVCGPLWKSTFLNKQQQLFDESIRNLDDWDFNLRMLYQNPSISYIQEPLIKYRIHDNSLSKELDKLNAEEIYSEFLAREKHLSLLKQNKALTKVLKNYIANRYKYFLREALIRKHSLTGYLLKKTLTKQFESAAYRAFCKTLVGYIFYRVFNKGYTFLK